MDISNEKYRTYYWPNGFNITIESPELIYVEEGALTIKDRKNRYHKLVPGWVYMNFELFEQTEITE